MGKSRQPLGVLDLEELKLLQGFEQRLMGPDCLSVGPVAPSGGDSTVRRAERGSFVRRLVLYPGEKW